MNVLITSVSRKVSLVKAFSRALSEEGGGKVIAIDASPKSAALYFADKAYIVPAGLGEEFLGVVQNICIKHEIKLLVPTRDEELPFFAEERERLNDIGVCVMVSSSDVYKRQVLPWLRLGRMAEVMLYLSWQRNRPTQRRDSPPRGLRSFI